MNLKQRLGHISLAIFALYGYLASGASWWMFAILILIPDLSYIALRRDPRIGAIVYIILHGWIGVIFLVVLGWMMNWRICIDMALIWTVHIGVDGALGYGLICKKESNDTDLGRIGG